MKKGGSILMKIFTALLGTESNTFSPFATGFQNFEETYLSRHGDHGENPAMYAVPLVVWRQLAEQLEIGRASCRERVWISVVAAS